MKRPRLWLMFCWTYSVPEATEAVHKNMRPDLLGFSRQVQSEIKRKWRSWTVNRYFSVDLKQQRHPSLASSGVNGGTQLSILSKSSSQIRMSSPLAENANISLPTWTPRRRPSTWRCRSRPTRADQSGPSHCVILYFTGAAKMDYFSVELENFETVKRPSFDIFMIKREYLVPKMR